MCQNILGRFLPPKHAQYNFDEPEVSLASKESIFSDKKYVKRIGKFSVVIYTKFYQNIKHRLRNTVKKYIINYDFDVTLTAGKFYFSTNKRNSVRIHACV